ncbi:phosphatidylserine decarboxylase, partial [Metarhizium majus ARSEF 297]
MKDSEQGITQKSRELCKKLLEQKQLPPIDSLFRDDLFDETCRDLQTRNEARVLRDIGMLLVPSAETLRKLRGKSLGSLIESVNESWSNCMPLDATRLTPTRPQPDYSLGFRREAFTEEELQRLEPFISDVFSQSYFAATYRMYFPFLASEAKCGREGLDVADRQNAHSMAIAVTAVVELFKAVGREKELDSMARSLSFQSLTIMNRSGFMGGIRPSVYPKPQSIGTRFASLTLPSLTAEVSGQQALTFTKHVYRVYMPGFLGLIQSAVDQLPHDLLCGIRTDLGGSENSGLSQQLESQSISAANGLGQMTPDSFGQLSSKRQKPVGDSATDVS